MSGEPARISSDAHNPEQDVAKRISLELERQFDQPQPADIESLSPSDVPRWHRPQGGRSRIRAHTAKLVASEVRDMIAKAYRGEVQSMIRWRDIWKHVGDGCEATAKCLAGAGAVLAFAASSIRDSKTADILSFASGSVGTLGLVLMTYSAYASRESRQRTMELNNILDSIGVTPLPNISNGRTEEV